MIQRRAPIRRRTTTPPKEACEAARDDERALPTADHGCFPYLTLDNVDFP